MCRFLVTKIEQTRKELHSGFADTSESQRAIARVPVQQEDQPFSVSLAGQAVGLKEVDHGIWLVSFMDCDFMDYDLGYIDLEEKNLAAPGEPLGAKSVTYASGTLCYPCLRNGH